MNRTLSAQGNRGPSETDVVLVCIKFKPVGSPGAVRGNAGTLAVYDRGTGSYYTISPEVDLQTFAFSPSVYKRVEDVSVDGGASEWVHAGVNRKLFPYVVRPVAGCVRKEGEDHVLLHHHATSEGVVFSPLHIRLLC